jgi:hypothetical protein
LREDRYRVFDVAVDLVVHKRLMDDVATSQTQLPLDLIARVLEQECE